jgi:hypothetical protein
VSGGEDRAKIRRWHLKGKYGGKPGDNPQESRRNALKRRENGEFKRRRHVEVSSCAFPEKYLLSY